MQRVAILVDDWNLLKAADRLKRRVDLAELAHAALARSLDRYIAFQRFYIGPNSGFGAAQRVERLAEEARSPAKLEQQLRGSETDYEPRFMETYKQLAAGRDVMVLEGGRSWREGYVAGLSPRRFVELVQSQALIVLRYDQTLLADRSLAARRATRSTSPPARAWLSASATRPFWPYHSLARRCNRGDSPERSSKPAAQQVGKKMMVAVPASLIVERDEKQVGPLQSGQHCLTVGVPGHGVAQRCTHLFQDGSLKQKLVHIWQLLIQNFFNQVIQKSGGYP